MSKKDQYKTVVKPDGVHIGIPLHDLDDFGAVLNCAIRYCIGRRTYMPSLVTSWIMQHCNNTLSEKTIWCAKRDIDEAKERNALGDPCDIDTWLKFRAWLDEQDETKK